MTLRNPRKLFLNLPVKNLKEFKAALAAQRMPTPEPDPEFSPAFTT